MLDFFFGRPLAETISMFEVRLVKKNGIYALVPTSAFSRKQKVF
jgi:hypothetical protein